LSVNEAAQQRNDEAERRRVAKALSSLQQAFDDDLSSNEKKSAFRKYVKECAGGGKPSVPCNIEEGHKYIVNLCLGFGLDRNNCGRWMTTVGANYNLQFRYLTAQPSVQMVSMPICLAQNFSGSAGAFHLSDLKFASTTFP